MFLDDVTTWDDCVILLTHLGLLLQLGYRTHHGVLHFFKTLENHQMTQN